MNERECTAVASAREPREEGGAINAELAAQLANATIRSRDATQQVDVTADRGPSGGCTVVLRFVDTRPHGEKGVGVYADRRYRACLIITRKRGVARLLLTSST